MNTVEAHQAEVLCRRDSNVLGREAQGHDHAVWSEAPGSIVTTVELTVSDWWR